MRRHASRSSVAALVMPPARAATSPVGASAPVAVVDQLADRAAVERRDRRAARQGFGDDEAERLVPRRGHDGDGALSDDRGELGDRRGGRAYSTSPPRRGRDLLVEVLRVVDRPHQRAAAARRAGPRRWRGAAPSPGRGDPIHDGAGAARPGRQRSRSTPLWMTRLDRRRRAMRRRWRARPTPAREGCRAAAASASADSSHGVGGRVQRRRHDATGQQAGAGERQVVHGVDVHEVVRRACQARGWRRGSCGARPSRSCRARRRRRGGPPATPRSRRGASAPTSEPSRTAGGVDGDVVAATDEARRRATWVWVSMPPAKGSAIGKRAAATIATSIRCPFLEHWLSETTLQRVDRRTVGNRPSPRGSSVVRESWGVAGSRRRPGPDAGPSALRHVLHNLRRAGRRFVDAARTGRRRPDVGGAERRVAVDR